MPFSAAIRCKISSDRGIFSELAGNQGRKADFVSLTASRQCLCSTSTLEEVS